jgi:hypothetical protein
MRELNVEELRAVRGNLAAVKRPEHLVLAFILAVIAFVFGKRPMAAAQRQPPAPEARVATTY